MRLVGFDLKPTSSFFGEGNKMMKYCDLAYMPWQAFRKRRAAQAIEQYLKGRRICARKRLEARS
jgi:hypothetical protein